MNKVVTRNYALIREEAIRLYQAGVHPREIAARLGIALSTVYKYIGGIRKKKEEQKPFIVVVIPPNFTQPQYYMPHVVGNIVPKIDWKQMSRKEATLQTTTPSQTTIATEKIRKEEESSKEEKKEERTNNMSELIKRNLWVNILKSRERGDRPTGMAAEIAKNPWVELIRAGSGIYRRTHV